MMDKRKGFLVFNSPTLPMRRKRSDSARKTGGVTLEPAVKSGPKGEAVFTIHRTGGNYHYGIRKAVCSHLANRGIPGVVLLSDSVASNRMAVR